MFILQKQLVKQTWWRIKKNPLKNTLEFSNNNIKKCVILLRKGVYLYEYMGKWEKFNETPLPEKYDFYSNLKIENFANSDYNHAKRVCNDFEIKNLDEYLDFYLKSDTLLSFNWFFWKTLEKCVQKFINCILQNFFHLQD